MKEIFKYGPWLVEHIPEDGARLHRLCFNGFDLLTIEQSSFRPPRTDYGAYELRPVYGYDDCFPSVESCRFPHKDWVIPDHGEICWLKWETLTKKDRLIFSVKSKVLPLLFTREMHFNETSISWKFKVANSSDQPLPFQHVIHPLMKLDDVTDLDLPAFDSIYNTITSQDMTLHDTEEVKKFLLSQSKGSTNMLFLRGVKSSKMSVTFKKGVRLEVIFPVKHLNSIGIWWNNSGYPDEDGCRRNECAFEPIPGSTSNLAEAYAEGRCLTVAAGKTFSWQIEWKMYS
jgi:hypothetical protein